MAFHPKGALLASDGWGGGTRLWDLSSGKQLLEVDAGPEDIDFSPDGSRMAVYSFEHSRAHLFNVAVNDATVDLRVPNQTFSQAAGDTLVFGPTGDWLLTRVDDAPSVWQPRTGQLLARAENQLWSTSHLVGQGRQVFSWNQDTYYRLSLVEADGSNRLALERFTPRIPPSLQSQCPPGLFENLATKRPAGHSGASLDGRIVAATITNRC